MSKKQIDEYLVDIEEPQKSTLISLRRIILEIIPNAEECITYRVPTFKIDGKGIAGYAAYRSHCTYFPMSGSVLGQIGEEVAKYKASRGALPFAVDKPLPKALVKKLIRVRLGEALSK